MNQFEAIAAPAARPIDRTPLAGATRWAVVVLSLLSLGAVVYFAALWCRPDENFRSRPLTEDGFYELSVARSIAAGHGFTVDGHTPTNGVQPLICLLTAPIFAAAGDDTTLALRLVTMFQAALYVFAALAIAWFASCLPPDHVRRRLYYWTVVALVLWNYSLSTAMMNGLETSLSIGLLFVSAGYYAKFVAPAAIVPPKRLALLGALLGLAVLGRIDSAVFVPILCLWHVGRRRSRARATLQEGAAGGILKALAESAVFGAIGFVVTLPWWVFNYTHFGSLVPTSGQAQAMITAATWPNVLATLRVLSDAMLVVVHAPFASANTLTMFAGAILAATAAVIVLVVPVLRIGAVDVARRIGRTWKLRPAVPLGIFTLALLVYYSFFFGAPHFQFRYLVTVRLFVVLAVAAVAVELWCSEGNPRVVRSSVACTLFLLMAIGGAAFSRNFGRQGVAGNFYAPVATWIGTHTAAGDRIGMFQAGTTGFFYPDRVVDLDGKVNLEALRALQHGTIGRYVDTSGFDYIIDWSSLTGAIFADARVRAKYRPSDTLNDGFVVWKRIAP